MPLRAIDETGKEYLSFNEKEGAKEMTLTQRQKRGIKTASLVIADFVGKQEPQTDNWFGRTGFLGNLPTRIERRILSEIKRTEEKK